MPVSATGLKNEVREYWEPRPCGSWAGTGAERSQVWFDQIEASRYQREPVIHSFAQFTRWRGKNVLEIGCGAGTDSVQFARAGARLTAIDLTDSAVALTRARLALEGLPGDVRVADAETLPFATGQFDLVYSWGVLHHTPDPGRALDEIRRVLKPGGLCLAMFYGRHSVTALRLYVKYGLRAGKPFRSFADVISHHVESAGTRAYTRRELEQLFHCFGAVSTQAVLTVYDVYRLPKSLQHWLPQAWGWFLVVQGHKEGVQQAAIHLAAAGLERQI